MLANAAETVPVGDGWTYEPKWDGVRVIVAREGDDLELHSRDGKPLLRYFPELRGPLLERLPRRAIVDGEIVLPLNGALDFDALQARIHPAASRVERLAVETPTRVVLFDVLGVDGGSVLEAPLSERRGLLADLLRGDSPLVIRTPWTERAEQAADWFRRFEGAGLDGVVAKRADQAYLPGKRGWTKIKRDRTTDVVVAGFRWHKSAPGVEVGSLLVGLYDAHGVLHQVGGVSGFTAKARVALRDAIAAWSLGPDDPHPWRAAPDDAVRRPGAPSRWRKSEDGTFEALRPERVVEVRFNQLSNGRFRHPATFVRWRDDRAAASCTLEGLPATPAEELSALW